jgi:8-amino-7-oxononanoate synthase
MAPDPLRWIGDELAALETAGLRRRRLVREGPPSIQAIRWGGRELVNFGSNDYLGLAACPRHAAVPTIEQAGGAAAPAL